jgi:asparagine synthase (glutamine-hydrolysing)
VSGICAIVAARSCVDAASVNAMSQRMAFRGPDGLRTWVSPNAGLGHAWLHTRDEAPQPFVLDALVVAADARLDARDELVSALRSAGHECEGDASEPELIAHAYAAWGERCVERLAGDFALIVWDSNARRLFCARDHFGVKPLFHARVGERVLVSNTLDALRFETGLSRELDDLAIADFLLFDASQDPASTAFAQIRRLRPGHCLTVSDGAVGTRRYWSLPRDHGVRYRDARDYVAHFGHLLDAAVGDRLRTQSVSVAMSGGLDSTALAASALRVARRAGKPLALKAHTIVYDSLIPDRERHFSQVAADALGIPITHRAADGYGLFAGGDDPWRRFAEPSHEPEGAGGWDLLRDEASFARVALMGWDGDALLRESPKPYLRMLWRQRRFGRFAADAAWYAFHEKRFFPRAGWRHSSGRSDDSTEQFPDWINPELERRLKLRDRWREVNARPATTHEVRPYAHAMLAGLERWSNFFDRFDPGFTRLHLDVRHPFLDLRLVEYCLSLPPVPWCVHKRILRESLAGVLPDEIRKRPKSHLGLPGLALLAREDARWVDDFVATEGLERYIQRSRIPRVWGQDRPSSWPALRPLTLHFWLQHQFTTTAQEIAA